MWDSPRKLGQVEFLSPSGAFLVVANQGSDNIAVFSVDPDSGHLVNQKVRDVCSTPFFVRFVAP